MKISQKQLHLYIYNLRIIFMKEVDKHTNQDPHDRIFNLLLSKTDEITWQTIIFDLVKSEHDRLLRGVEEEMEELGFEEPSRIAKLDEIPTLIPRTPQPRQRKVSIYDLVEALERELEVKKRRLLHSIPPLNME